MVLNAISPNDLLPAFVLLSILQSFSLVFIVRRKFLAEMNNRRMLNPQTGALNLKGFENSAAKIRHMSGRLDQAVSLVVMKISDYDQLKSQLSKEEVNKILTDLVSITKFCLRKYDEMAQVGENQFVLLFPFTDLIRAQQACERLSRQLAVELLVRDGDALSPVAVSMGITDMPRAEKDVDAAIRRADKAMQKAGQINIFPALKDGDFTVGVKPQLK